MKKLFLTLILNIIILMGYSQNISVSSFKLLDSDLTANTAGTMEQDQNGEVAALIKVVTTQTGFTFDGGALGIVKTKQTPGEVWVYVPRGSKKITIKHPQLGVLRDYYYPIAIEAARTYEMMLVTGTVQTIVQQTRTSQYVVFQLNPPNAIVELDGSLLQTVDGTASKMMKFGSYDYRVQAPNYLSESGKVTVDDPDNKKVVSVTLKPNFSKVTVKVDNNAEIWINGEKKGNGTWTGDLGEGTYEFEAKLQGHRNTLLTRDLVITQEPQIINLQSPTPIYGEADINSSPAMADIYIDGKKSGQTPQLISKLLVGLHQLRLSKEGYDDHTASFTIKEGETTSLSVQLEKKKATITSTANNNHSNGKWRFAYINSQEIIQSMPEFVKARSEIEILVNQYESNLKSMQEELQKKSDAYEKEQYTLPAYIKQRRETELQEMYQKIQQSYQDNQQTLAKEQNERMQAITSKVLDAVKNASKKEGFLYVFDNNTICLNTVKTVNLTETIKAQMGLSNNSIKEIPKTYSNKIGYVKSTEILSLMNITNNTDSLLRLEATTKVSRAMEDIAITNDFAFILDEQSGIPFINDTFVCDVTKLVEKELNLINEIPLIPNKDTGNAKFAHFNAQEVIQAMPEFTKARAEIEALTKRFEADLKSMQDELQKKAEAYDKEQATLPANIKQRRETELQEMYQKIQQSYQDNQQALAKEQNERMQAITTKVINAIHQIGDGSKYALILDIASGIPYISTTLSTDVTAEVKAKLALK